MRIKQWLFNFFKKEILSAVGYENVAVRLEHIKPTLISSSKVCIIGMPSRFTTQGTLMYDMARTELIRTASEYIKAEWTEGGGEKSVRLSLYVAKPL